MAAKIGTVIIVAVGVFMVVWMLRDINAPNTYPWDEIAPSGAQPPATSAGIPEPGSEVFPGASAIVVQGLGNAPVLGALVAALAISAVHRRRARAQRAFDPRAPLRDGAALIFGEVESLPGHEGPVVEIRIEQYGTQQTSKGNTSHTWKEVDREVRISPFIVVCHDGTRVRVEPDEQIVLEDGLAVVVGNSVNARSRRAALVAGAQVHITGELRGVAGQHARDDVYRGASGSAVLGPPRFGRMVISTERPGETEEARARYHARWAVLLVVIFGLLAGLMLPSYELLAFDGKTVMAEVTGSRTWQEWVKPKNQSAHLVTYYGVRARAPSGDGSFLPLDDDCNAAIYYCVKQHKCTHVPFRVSTHVPRVYELGTRPTIGVGRGMLIFLLFLALAFGYPLGTIDSRPWYMKKKLNESGSGSLAQSNAGG
jgi:hypothetical protein